jgi:hypothetical protein
MAHQPKKTVPVGGVQFAADKVVYYYTSLDTLLKIIKSESLWASDVTYMNDASELEYAVGLLMKEVKRRQARATKDQRKGLANILKWLETRAYRAHNLFAACFSSDGDLLSQWRSYTPPGQGVSIGISLETLSRLLLQSKFELAKCIYSRREQLTIVRENLDRFVARAGVGDWRPRRNAIADPKFDELCRKFEETLILGPAARLKSPAFREEKEFRVISKSRHASDSEIRYRMGLSTLVPYVAIRLINGYSPKLNFSEVIAGPTPHEEAASRAVFHMLNANKVLFGNVHSSKIPFRSW